MRTATSAEPEKRAAVFLDRDGTICEEVGYINHIDRLRLFPWTAPAVRKLNRAGMAVVVVTNQSGVGQGYFPEELVHRVHERIREELASQGAQVDAFYYCPHHPKARLAAYRKACACRKPETGMLEQAAADLGLDLGSAYVVGDSTRDIETGCKVRARTVLVLTGYGKGNYEYHRAEWVNQPDWVAENLLEAVERIVAQRFVAAEGNLIAQPVGRRTEQRRLIPPSGLAKQARLARRSTPLTALPSTPLRDSEQGRTVSTSKGSNRPVRK